MDYVYVKEALLGAPGFAYGKGKVRTGRTDQVRVRRLASGRWEELPTFAVSLARATLRHRVVSEQEALSGIGTYVGSCICVPRVVDHSARAWSYGVVVGYEWKPETSSGPLHVDFGDKNDAVVFNSAELQAIAMSTYALRPCLGRPIADIMTGEMRELNQAVYDAFEGINCQAARDSTSIRGSMHSGPLDETQRVPLYDLSTGRVVLLTLKHILDFVFYKEGDRAAPAGIRLGRTVFDYSEPASVPVMTSNDEDPVAAAEAETMPRNRAPERESARSPGAPPILSASDSEVEVLPGLGVPEDNRDRAGRPKRRRDAEQDHFSQESERPNASRGALNEYEEFLEFKRARQQDRTSGPVRPDIRDVGKSPFRPSALQQTIHGVLVNGKYSMWPPLLFLETLQTDVEDLPVIAHPAVLRAFFSWDFGSHGLSVMHFARQHQRDRREAEQTYDFGDFTAKNKLPQAKRPSDVTEVVAALDELAGIVQKVCKAVMSDVVAAAKTFANLLTEDISALPQAALTEVVYWIDKRLQKVRTALAASDLSSVYSVLLEFKPNSSTHQRLLNIILEQRVNYAVEVRVDDALQVAHTKTAISTSATNPRAQTQKAVPASVLNALPTRDGKQLCMRFLSREGCHSKGASCFTSDRGHFKPQRLPTVVRTWISKNYGGVREEYSSL